MCTYTVVPCWMVIERELATEIGVCLKTALNILHDILSYHKLSEHWIPHEIWHRYTVAQACWTGTKGSVKTFLDESSLWTKPEFAYTTGAQITILRGNASSPPSTAVT